MGVTFATGDHPLNCLMEFLQVNVQSFVILLMLIKPLCQPGERERERSHTQTGGGRGEERTLSVSLFLLAILEMDCPTFFTNLMNPAPLSAVVSVAFGSCRQTSNELLHTQLVQ